MNHINDRVFAVFRKDLNEQGDLAALSTTALNAFDGFLSHGDPVCYQYIDNGDDAYLKTFVLIDATGIANLAASQQPNSGVQPNDFNASTNPKLWYLMEKVDCGGVNGWFSQIIPEAASIGSFDGYPYARMVPVPATAGSAGGTGQMAFSAGFLYVCIGANSWKRAALSTF